MTGRTRIVASLAGCLLLTGVAVDCVRAQSKAKRVPRESPRIVAFGDSAAGPAAPQPDTLEPAAPAAAAPEPRAVAYGALIPTAPRVVAAAAKGRPRKPPEFGAATASATRFSINSSYGVRVDPLTGVPRMHTGVDLSANYGETVGASMSGRVAFAGVRGGYGNLVVVDHGHGVATYYAHLSAISVVAGEEVAAGQVVGYVGSTGRSTGPHLHYEVRANGFPLDPATEIHFDGESLFVHGRRLDPHAADEAPALPPAPGGTLIAVDWGATGQGSGRAMLVDFE